MDTPKYENAHKTSADMLRQYQDMILENQEEQIDETEEQVEEAQEEQIEETKDEVKEEEVDESTEESVEEAKDEEVDESKEEVEETVTQASVIPSTQTLRAYCCLLHMPTLSDQSQDFLIANMRACHHLLSA